MRLIAFYLPQFHPIPENDRWWGKGFTEWDNVARARPLFPWHRQPMLPGELGFYDLRVPEVRRAQAALAREHGIHAFCYHHYWFGGKLLLERPLEEVLRSGEPDFPFCISWANENWTRAWDGRENDVLIRQQHSEEDDRRHFNWLAQAFRDRRYVRVHGRPLLLVYRLSLLPDPARTAAIWREEARALGIEDPYLCTVESLRDDRKDPETIGFDAAVEFQPDWLNVGTPDLETPEGNRVFDYEAFVERQLAKPAAPYTRFPCVTPNWDNTARRQKDAFIMRGSTPEVYGRWLDAVLESRRSADPDEDLVFVNSWNEWGEGAALEPDHERGRAYLEATRRSVNSAARRALARDGGKPVPASGRVRPAPKVSVCIPAFNGSAYIGAAIQSVLGQTLSDFELIVVDDASADGTPDVVRSFRDSRVSLHVNPSRLGIAGNWNRCLDYASAPFVSLFHQDDLMMPANLAAKVEFLEKHPRAGMVFSNVWQIGPADELISRQWYDPPDFLAQGVHAGPGFFRRLVLGRNIVCAPSVVARREVFDVLGGFETGLPFTLDWEMWLRIAGHYDVGYLQHTLVRYRRHPGMETDRFAGALDLEHGFRARRLALERASGWLRDAGALKNEIVESCRLEALRLAAEKVKAGRPDEAHAFVRVAVEVGGRAEPARGPENGASRGGNGSGAVPIPLPQRESYWEALTQSRAIDVAQGIAARKLVSAMGLKLGARRGFRWVPKLMGVRENSP